MSQPKVALSASKIVALLKNKGMTFDDESIAISFFESNNYYRFRSFFYEMLDVDNPHQEFGKLFNSTVGFEEIKNRYEFDNNLRSSLFEAIQVIELCLREKIILILAKENALSYLDSKTYYNPNDNNRAKRHKDKQINKFRRKLDDLKNKSSLPFTNQASDLDLWCTLEIMDYGSLTALIRIMRNDHKQELAKIFGYKDESLFADHLLMIGKLRNICAHHQILWKYDFTTHQGHTVKIPNDWDFLASTSKNRLYNIILILEYISHKTIAKNTSWQKNFLFHCMIAMQEQVSLFLGYGFPENWQDHNIWHNHIRELEAIMKANVSRNKEKTQ